MLGRVLGAATAQRREVTASVDGAARSIAPDIVIGGSSESQAYRSAMRHSRRVRLLRKAIPVACLAALVGPVAWGIVSPFARSNMDVKVGPISVAGTKVTMEAPKLSGFKKDNKSYLVTADQAVQDLKQPSVVELNRLAAQLEQEDKKFVRLKSDWGRFDQNGDRLDLKGNVQVRTDTGYEADLRSARVNVKSGDIVTTEPVAVRNSDGSSTTADTMELKDNGKYVVFEGRVRSILVQTDASADTPIRTKTQ
jgi:lipopolysaccharide export system protein LptC